MIKNKKLAKSIQDCAWSEFFRMLEYKSEWYGRTIIKVSQWFPSSKTCSDCGSINKDLKLKD
jgi:putative transposase